MHVLSIAVAEKADHTAYDHLDNMTLINKTKFLSDEDFIIRMLYKYSYISFLGLYVS